MFGNIYNFFDLYDFIIRYKKLYYIFADYFNNKFIYYEKLSFN